MNKISTLTLIKVSAFVPTLRLKSGIDTESRPKFHGFSMLNATIKNVDQCRFTPNTQKKHFSTFLTIYSLGDSFYYILLAVIENDFCRKKRCFYCLLSATFQGLEHIKWNTFHLLCGSVAAAIWETHIYKAKLTWGKLENIFSIFVYLMNGLFNRRPLDLERCRVKGPFVWRLISGPQSSSRFSLASELSCKSVEAGRVQVRLPHFRDFILANALAAALATAHRVWMGTR